MGKFVFRKEERLNKELWIKELFEKGSSFHLYPFRIVSFPHPDPHWPYTQILISVPVRNFKRAVDRNTIKRRIREAYRLNKHAIKGDQKWLIAYIYTAKDIQNSTLIHEKVMASFGRIGVKAK
jgi:ribonuclease P protein component